MNVCEDTMPKAAETLCQSGRAIRRGCVLALGVSLLLLAPAPLRARTAAVADIRQSVALGLPARARRVLGLV